MSEKPHTVAIGAFVIGAILIAITIVIFALGSGFGQQREKVVMVFDGSVKGLVVGAPVTLRGVQIGQVTNLELRLDADKVEFILVVESEINTSNIRRLGSNPDDVTDELIRRGLRAQLKTQSLLTGLLYIQLEFHPEKPPVFVELQTDHLQIPTIPTDLELLTRQVEDLDLGALVKKLEGIVNGLNVLVTSKDFQALPGELATTLASLSTLGDELRSQVKASGPRLDQVLDRATVTLSDTNRALPQISERVEKSLDELDIAIAAFGKTMTNADQLVAPDSATAYQLNRALQEMTMAGRAVRQLADTLSRHPEALLRGRGEDPQ